MTSKKRQGNEGWPRVHLELYGLYRELKTKSSEIEAGSAGETPELGKEFMQHRQISLALTGVNVLLCAGFQYRPQEVFCLPHIRRENSVEN